MAAAFADGLFDPTGFAAASIVIWAAVIAGLVARALPTGQVSRPAAAAGLCLAATAVLATASVAWASDQGRAFEEAVRVSFYLGLFVLAACTATRGGRRDWIAGLTGGLGIVTVVALFSYLQPGILDSGRSSIPNAAGRLSYPVGYWNGAGALLAVAAVLLSYAGASASTRAWRSSATALVPLAVLGIWLASSRGAGVALLVGCAALILASTNRPRQLLSLAIGGLGAAVLIVVGNGLDDLTKGVADSGMRADGDLMSVVCLGVSAACGALAWGTDGWRIDGWISSLRLSRRMALVAAGVLIVAVAAGVVAADPSKRLHEFETPPAAQGGVPVGAADLSSNGRWQFWGQALDAFQADPIAGVGAGGFEDWWGRHASVALFVRNPHSLPLQQAAELGVLGIALFFGFLVALAVAARERLRTRPRGDANVLVAVVAAGAIGALFDWTWEIPAVFGPAVVCSALILASARSRPLARNGYWLGIGTVSAAWVAMVAAGLVVLTNLELDQSRNAAEANRIGEGIDRARAAKTVQPWSSEPYTRLAVLEYQAGNAARAMSYLQQAKERDSDDWRLWLIEASLLQRSGDGAGSRAAYARAQSLSPIPLNLSLTAAQG